MPDLLIELFSEEIPARMQTRAAADLKKLVTDGLVAAGLTYASAGAFATPRRLALSLDGLTAQSRATRVERKGPATSAPEQAVQGFLRSTGLTLDQLEVRDDKKGQVYFAVVEKPGRDASEIVAEVLEATIRNFPWPKSMRWGAGSLKWVRPLHSILCILSAEDGASIVPLDVDGITAGDTTKGHRFLSQGTLSVTGFDDYATKLKRAYVVLDAEERANHIWHDATTLAFAQGLEVVEDRALLTEVAGLVEWPVVLIGTIGEDFLDLPAEVLQTSMREHQKFFSVKNPKSGRIEKFITVANTETADHGATILAGNQKVLAARLSDAKFFWKNDLRIATAGMGQWLAALENVTFHNLLGSQMQRILRISTLAREIASEIGANADAAETAAKYAKADLASEMVNEFPELQGVMGCYYASHAGLDFNIAAAAQAHYAPLGPSDDVPNDQISVVVALADKIDSLVSFWAINEKPTGSKDPFALRRATLGVVRIVTENEIRLQMRDLFRQALGVLEVENSKLANSLEMRRIDVPNADLGLKDVEGDLADDLIGFFHDRLKVYLRDRGIRHDVIDACIVMEGNDDLTLLVKRAEALSETLKTDDGENLLQGFKRANNILSQAEEKDGVEYSYGADVKFAETPEETSLFTALDAAEAKIAPAMKAEDFAAAMSAMAALRAPLDAFFDAVQVNTDSSVLRRNRLNLLSRIRTLCLSVADLTKIEG